VKTQVEMLVRLRISGDDGFADLALESALDGGALQNAINEYPDGGVRVVAATSESVPTFARHEGRIHDHVIIQDEEDDGPDLRITAIAGDDPKDTISLQFDDAHLKLSFRPTALEAEQLGHLLIAAARDTLHRTSGARLRAVRS
jgi:hypothetical protein